MERFYEHKYFNRLMGLLLIGVILWIFVAIRTNIKNYHYIGRSTYNTISVNGTGKVIAKPNIATINIGVMAEKGDVAAAQDENSKKMNALIAQIKNLGVEEKDIKTTNYAVYPQYDYPGGKQQIRGYQVSQEAQIKIRDLAKVSAALKAATESGANQVSGISFTIDEPENLRREARDKALTNARENAEQIAKQLDVALGRVIGYNEYQNPQPGPVPYYAKDISGIGGPAAQEAPTIQPGSNEVVVDVTVTYEIW